MSELSRIGVAIEGDLLADFDAYLEKHHYPSRSEAFRDLIRDALATDPGPDERTEVVGTVTLVYSHSTRHLGDRITALQHDHHACIVSTMHVHLDHDDCLEVVVVRGRAGKVRELADALIAMKGVRQGRLFLSPAQPHETAPSETR
ncbi:MAG: nickel-responsive transcriptional regulator NikR [Pseudomonadales bacterium]